MITKVVELTGYNFGADEDHAAEVVWHVVRTAREKKLDAVEVTITRNTLRVTLNVAMHGPDYAEWLKAATAHLVSAVTVGVQAGHMRGEGLGAKVLDV